MRVIRTRVGVAVASFGLLASGFALTVAAAVSTVPTAVAVAASMSANPLACPNATLIDAGKCVPR
jgi:hypothetical protein